MRYHCDVPMAKKKKVLQYCNRKCNECLCAIRTDGDGRQEHVGDMPQGCPIIQARNFGAAFGKSRKRG